jgi:hypothetical protein
MAVLEAATAGEDHHAIRDAITALDLATKPFAQARMNRAVAAAMHGRSIDAVEREVDANVHAHADAHAHALAHAPAPQS